MLNDRKREKSLKRSADDVLLYDGPGAPLHRTDLHADALQGVVEALPLVPLHSNSKESFISPSTINPVGMTKVAAVAQRVEQVG